MAERTKKREGETSIIRELLGWIVYIIIIIALTYLIVTYI